MGRFSYENIGFGKDMGRVWGDFPMKTQDLGKDMGRFSYENIGFGEYMGRFSHENIRFGEGMK